MIYKTITTCFCLLICFTVNAQTLKKVKQLSDDKLYREVFTIDKETELREGEYSKYKAGLKELVEKGNYINGLRHGYWYYFESEDAYWVEVFSQGKSTNYRKLYYYDRVCAKGAFIDGIKTGIWNFYDTAESRMMTYDYDNSKILWASEKIKVENKSIYIDEQKGTRPFIIGGKRRLMQEIQNVMPYFDDRDYELVEGRVVLSFIIDKNGKIHSPEIVVSTHKNLTAEVFRIYELVFTKLEWIPATTNGKFKDSTYFFPFGSKFTD